MILGIIMRMDLELTQIVALIDVKDLSGEQLYRISAQIAEITYQKERILGLLHLCTIEKGKTSRSDNERAETRCSGDGRT
jgi:hypothetical protein